jgi:hypothetical protein
MLKTIDLMNYKTSIERDLHSSGNSRLFALGNTTPKCNHSFKFLGRFVLWFHVCGLNRTYPGVLLISQSWFKRHLFGLNFACARCHSPIMQFELLLSFSWCAISW